MFLIGDGIAACKVRRLAYNLLGTRLAGDLLALDGFIAPPR